ncbi:MAG: phenylalanine--tRNA ligase subunit alpha, partial [Proteobacteria bacterium]
MSTDSVQEKLTHLLDDAISAITAADSVSTVEALRVKYLGKKGIVTEQLKQLGSLPADERPQAGRWVN